MKKQSKELQGALQVVRITAAHHLELVELAQEGTVDVTAAIVDAGDCLDIALIIAYAEGANTFELCRASDLPLRYVLDLTSGTL